MKNPQYRYFIELQPHEGQTVARAQETASRRAAALRFLETVRNWLTEKDLSEKVSALTVTMFGQIQITCEADIIKRIRNEESAGIAAIRKGAMYNENLNRWHEAH